MYNANKSRASTLLVFEARARFTQRKPRDTQRKRLYTAEKALAPLSKRLETVAEIEAYVERARSRATLKRRYGPELAKPVLVKDGRRCRSASGSSYGITMPRWSRTQYIVLHELAHVLTQRRYGRLGAAGHGPEYARIYVDLVRYMMGPEAADVLKRAFDEGRVKWRARRP